MPLVRPAQERDALLTDPVAVVRFRRHRVPALGDMALPPRPLRDRGGVEFRVLLGQPAMVGVLRRAVRGIVRPLEDAIAVVLARLGAALEAGREVLFADHAAVIAAIGQRTGDERVVGGQRHAVGPQAMRVRIHARHQAGAGGAQTGLCT